METRRRWSVLIAVVVSLVALASGRGAAQPTSPGVDPVPVRGDLSPQGAFVGHLTITRVTEGNSGRLHLTGVLHGAVTDRHGKPRQNFQIPPDLVVKSQAADMAEVI
jgi:hypothetical protein